MSEYFPKTSYAKGYVCMDGCVCVCLRVRERENEFFENLEKTKHSKRNLLFICMHVAQNIIEIEVKTFILFML